MCTHKDYTEDYEDYTEDYGDYEDYDPHNPHNPWCNPHNPGCNSQQEKLKLERKPLTVIIHKVVVHFQVIWSQPYPLSLLAPLPCSFP